MGSPATSCNLAAILSFVLYSFLLYNQSEKEKQNINNLIPCNQWQHQIQAPSPNSRIFLSLLPLQSPITKIINNILQQNNRNNNNNKKE